MSAIVGTAERCPQTSLDSTHSEQWVGRVIEPAMPVLFDLSADLAEVARSAESELGCRIERAIAGLDRVLGEFMALRSGDDWAHL